MRIPFLHASTRELYEFAHGQVTGSGPLKRHLESCEQCRSEVRVLRELRSIVSDTGPTRPSDALLERIRRRIANNEPVVLPIADPSPQASWQVAASIAAVIVICALVWALWPKQTVRGSTLYGELRFTPNHLVTGKRIEVEYRVGSILSGVDRVVLRARFRTMSDQPYAYATKQTVAAELTPDAGGVFRGSFTIPDSAVYAAFTVENKEGTRVDHNEWRLWDLLRETQSGKATFDALEQQANDLFGRNMEEALRVTQKRAVLYPELPQSWGSVAALERFMLGKPHDDSSMASHIARLYRFDDEFRRLPKVPYDEMEGIRTYAVQVQDSGAPRVRQIRRYWLKREEADSSRTIQARIMRGFAFSDSARVAPAKFLPVLDSLWQADGRVLWFLPGNAWVFSRNSRNDRATLLWTDRLAAYMPGLASYNYGELLKTPSLRDSALIRLRASLPALYRRQDSLRPLELSVEEEARIDARTASEILKSIGTALVAEGKIREGLDTLDLASRGVWDANLFRQIAEVRLSARDTLGSLPLFAFVAADPGSTRAFADSVLARFRGSVHRARWTALVDSASREMRKRVLRDAISRAYDSTARLINPSGRPVALRQLASGKVVVFTFWSRYCGISRQQQIPALDRLSTALARYGVTLVAIGEEPPSPDLAQFFQKQRVMVPLYYDRWREAGRAFSQWGTPQYDIVDSEGRIRFARTSQAKVLAQAAALSQEHNQPTN